MFFIRKNRASNHYEEVYFNMLGPSDIKKIQSLGKNSYGKVFEIEIEKLSQEKTFALKIVNEDFEKVKKEIEIMKIHKHKNLVPLIGHSVKGDEFDSISKSELKYKEFGRLK